MTYKPEQRARDWAFIWATAEGQRAIADLFNGCGLFKPVYDDRPERMAFNEGRRNVALDILQYLALKPEQFRAIHEAMSEVEDDGF